MKVKIFTSTSASVLEEDVNDFISVREIIGIQFSSANREDRSIVFSALIMYK